MQRSSLVFPHLAACRWHCPWLGELPAMMSVAAVSQGSTGWWKETRGSSSTAWHARGDRDLAAGNTSTQVKQEVKHQGHASSLPPHAANAPDIPSHNEQNWKKTLKTHCTQLTQITSQHSIKYSARIPPAGLAWGKKSTEQKFNAKEEYRFLDTDTWIWKASFLKLGGLKSTMYGLKYNVEYNSDMQM